MARFVVTRIFQSVLTLFGVLTATFFLVRLAGDPTSCCSRPRRPRKISRSCARRSGSTSPSVQYVKFLANTLAGDFGVSLRQRTSALGLVLERLPATLELALTAFAFGMLIAFALGLAMRLTRRASRSRGHHVIALVRQAIPVFWFGLLLILLFSVYLRWLPSLGRGTWHLVLPALTLATYETRALPAAVQCLAGGRKRQDYVRTAYAKGQGRVQVLFAHMLPNALLPLITIAGINLGLLLGGTVVTETVFSWPGVGRLIVQSVSQRDYPVIIAGVFVVCLISSRSTWSWICSTPSSIRA